MQSPHVVKTKYKNCHNSRPTQLLIVSLKTTTDDLIEPAGGSLILGYLQQLMSTEAGLAANFTP